MHRLWTTRCSTLTEFLSNRLNGVPNVRYHSGGGVIVLVEQQDLFCSHAREGKDGHDSSGATEYSTAHLLKKSKGSKLSASESEVYTYL